MKSFNWSVLYDHAVNFNDNNLTVWELNLSYNAARKQARALNEIEEGLYFVAKRTKNETN